MYIIRLGMALGQIQFIAHCVYKTGATCVERMSAIVIKYWVFENYCMVQETPNILLYYFTLYVWHSNLLFFSFTNIKMVLSKETLLCVSCS